MKIEDRFIEYCRIDTQSDPENEAVTPSSEKQFDLAKLLLSQLQELGVEDASLDEHCYVYGSIPSNMDTPTKTVGFIAHMDTAPDFSGKNVKPRIIENYDGKDIPLNDEITMTVEEFPQLTKSVGKRLIVTDGNTLLGGDDKAGIAAMMDMVSIS